MFTNVFKRFNNLYDLESLRNWLIDVLSLIFVFVLPVNLAFVFPVFIKSEHYILISLDVILWLLMAIRVFIPSTRPYINRHIFLGLFSVIIMGFFLALGPGYSRPAWYITCTVLYALFAGTLASIIFISLSSIYLISLYSYLTPDNPAWQIARTDGTSNWVTFMLTLVMLALLAALSAGFVLSRLTSSLDHERQASLEYQAAMEELEASNEEFEAINEELLISQKLLQDSENLYRELAEVLPLIVFKCSTNGMINYANPRAFRDTGYDQSDFDKGIPLSSLFTSDCYERGLANYNRLCTEKTPSEGEYKLKRKDGSSFPALVYAAPILHDGVLAGITGAVMDISSRLEIEEENRRVHEHLHQAQKMEAIGTLAGGIAHDFNNILTGIIGYTEIARDDSTEPEIKESLTHVLQFSSRATDLVRQILTLSRRHEHKKVPVNIVPIIKETIKLLRASLPATISIDINDQSVSDTIIADPTEILQVMMNLGTNSAHAMKEHGGRIFISIENTDSSVTHEHHAINAEKETMLKIIFSDTGSGIPVEIIGKIFDPFYTTKPAGEGTGLGLSITDSIIRDSGGSITVSSKPGQGTTFEINFPIYQNGEKESQDEKAEKRREGNGHVLVIDDEAPIAYMEKVMLEKLGYTVDMCGSSSEGLVFFKENPNSYDLVITDQTMPKLTGTELSKEIHKLRPEIPVLLCTGFSDTVSRENYQSLGISGMIYKPISLSILSMEVNRLLQNRNKTEK